VTCNFKKFRYHESLPTILLFFRIPMGKMSLKDVEFTCPMHPEIRQMGPGNCPICGMALEPVTFSAEQSEDNHEYLDMRKRFIVSATLSIPLVFLAMGGRNLFSSLTGERLVALFAPSPFPHSFVDHMTGEIDLYFEAAAEIVTRPCRASTRIKSPRTNQRCHKSPVRACTKNGKKAHRPDTYCARYPPSIG
jgi:hypothetical protein